MPADQQRQIVDTLLSPKDGAGLSILRLGIGSAPDGVGDNCVYPSTADIQDRGP
jgi:hypothetical protein